MSEYCRQIVKQHDPDRYLLSLFAPQKQRGALWALYAFNFEIARTRETVSDTTIGLIRLQWWRDGIAEIYAGKPVRQHMILDALKTVITAYDLPRDLFDNLIYAREFDLEGVAPANMEGLLKYCEYTNVPLQKLSLKILGEHDNDTDVVDISVDYTLIGVIRAVPYMWERGQVLLPQDVLKAHGLSPQKMLNIKGKEVVSSVIKEVFQGGEPYRNAKGRKKISKFLTKTRHMAYLYQQQVEKAGFDVFDVRVSRPPPFMALRLWLGI